MSPFFACHSRGGKAPDQAPPRMAAASGGATGHVTDIRPPADASPAPSKAFRPCGPTGFPAHPLSPAAWALLLRVRRRLARFPLFDRREYGRRHPGPGRQFPLTHFLHCGMYRNQPIFPPVYFAKALAERLQVTPPDNDEVAAPAIPDRPIGVFASSLGNSFMAEIADDLAASLAAAGARVVRGDERCPRSRRPRTSIYVAPHEFFALGRGPAWTRPDILRGAVLYNTEQSQTPWFWRALPLLLASRGVLDLSWHTASLLGEVMPSAHVVPGLGLAPWTLPADRPGPALLDGAWWRGDDTVDPRSPLADRPLDLVFFGGETEARDRFFARHAARFAGLDCLIYLRKRGRGPINAANAEGDLCPCARLACGRARLTVSVHRDAFGFFEWHRLVRQAMASGSVAVTERCFPVPDFRPGTHYFCEDADRLPQLIEWLLRDPDGRVQAERARDRCLDLLAHRFRPEQAGRRLLSFLDRLEHGHAV